MEDNNELDPEIKRLSGASDSQGERAAYYLVHPNALKSGENNYPKDNTANPAPLGLLGFGLTTFLLNLANAGVYPVNSMVLAMGVFYGGVAQILAGIFEWKKGNVFGMVAFLSYGLFWISFCFLLMLPATGLAAAPDDMSLALYCFIWGIFSTNMFVATLKKSPWALVFVFFTVVVLFFLLAAAFWTGSPKITKAAGVEGIICGLSAIYVAFGEINNEIYGRTIIPLGVRTVTTKKD